jgi:hypothetical protein
MRNRMAKAILRWLYTKGLLYGTLKGLRIGRIIAKAGSVEEYWFPYDW